MEIILIRHTKVNVDLDVCYGFTDIDLHPDYKDHFSEVEKKFKDYDLKNCIFYTSPLKRCYLLAEYLSNINYITDFRLQELNFGDWEMIQWNLIDEITMNKWIEDYANYKCPNGESFINLYDRVIQFYNELITRPQDKVVIVTHGGVIRCLLSHILEIPLKNVYSIKIDFGSLSRIELNDQMVAVSFINR